MLLNRREDSPATIQAYMDSYVPSAGLLFGESVKFGLNTLWMTELYQENLFNEASKETTITSEEYKNSKHYRPNINWFDGMTLGQAEILAESQDRKAYYAELTKNVSGFSGMGLVSFAGMMVGSLPDPLNFVPFWGVAKNLIRARKLTSKIAKLKTAQKYSKMGKFVPSSNSMYSVVDPMIGAGLATYMVGSKRKKFQEEWDMSMVATDALIAGGIGFSMWGAGKLASRLKKAPVKERVDRTARGTEQIEEVPFGGPNLRPDGGAGGINYAIPFNRVIATSVGKVTLNGTVDVSGKIYAGIDSINVKTPEEAILAVNESLESIYAEGFSGLHISDNIDKEVLDSIVENLDMTSINLETRPNSNGHIIERVQDDANWNYVKRDEEPLIDPEQEAEIAMAKDSEVESNYNASFEADESFTTNMNRMSEADTVSADAQRIQDGVNQATSCVIKNG